MALRKNTCNSIIFSIILIMGAVIFINLVEETSAVQPGTSYHSSDWNNQNAVSDRSQGQEHAKHNQNYRNGKPTYSTSDDLGNQYLIQRVKSSQPLNANTQQSSPGHQYVFQPNSAARPGIKIQGVPYTYEHQTNCNRINNCNNNNNQGRPQPQMSKDYWHGPVAPTMATPLTTRTTSATPAAPKIRSTISTTQKPNNENDRTHEHISTLTGWMHRFNDSLGKFEEKLEEISKRSDRHERDVFEMKANLSNIVKNITLSQGNVSSTCYRCSEGSSAVGGGGINDNNDTITTRIRNSLKILPDRDEVVKNDLNFIDKLEDIEGSSGDGNKNENPSILTQVQGALSCSCSALMLANLEVYKSQVNSEMLTLQRNFDALSNNVNGQIAQLYRMVSFLSAQLTNPLDFDTVNHLNQPKLRVDELAV